LGLCLGRCHWLRWELKHGCRLTLAQERQQHDSPIRKFERIVMSGQPLLIDLSKDGRLVVNPPRLPPEETSQQARNFSGEGKFRSRHHTHCQSGIIRGGEGACPSAKVARYELIADLRGARTYSLEAKVTHL
jgi:hypothetical protein